MELGDLFIIFASAAYEQHDVQELCRIMFDALKQKWSKSGNSFQDFYRYVTVELLCTN